MGVSSATHFLSVDKNSIAQTKKHIKFIDMKDKKISAEKIQKVLCSEEIKMIKSKSQTVQHKMHRQSVG